VGKARKKGQRYEVSDPGSVVPGGPDESTAHQDGMKLDGLAILGTIGEIFALAVDGGDAELDLGQIGQPDEV
jgi:hypothetical protein